MKPLKLQPTIVATAILCGSLFHNEAALAADGCPAPSFAAPSTNKAGFRPISVVVGDFNGDGKHDLVVVNSGSDDVSVLLGDGDGAFRAAVNYPAGGVSAAAGDFNDDGKPDLAVSGDGIRMLSGNGDGTFQTAVEVARVTGRLAVGDFNGDGRPDLAVASGDSASVSVLLSKGDGTFQPPINHGMGTSLLLSVVASDFNGDGKLDLALANAGSYDPGSSTYTNSGVSVLLGNGDGAFRADVNYGAGSVPGSVAIGDFNGDGKADLAVANSGSDDVSVLLGNGDGTFQAAVNYGAGTRPRSVAVGDFNGDDKPIWLWSTFAPTTPPCCWGRATAHSRPP